MQNYIILFILIIFLLLGLYIEFIWFKRHKKLPEEKIKDFKKKLKQIENCTSNKEKIIDTDKLYHKILLECWYNWDFWKILKEKPIKIKNLDKIWELHKLRNKLVHDFDNFEEKMLITKSKEFVLEIENLIKNFS